MHDRIRVVYQRDSGNGQIRALARALGLPRWKVSRYAVEHGWTAKQIKEPDWSEEEVDILTRNAHLGFARIQARLRARGFHRSVFGIQLKRKRLRLVRNGDGQSARGLAECLGVDVHFVLKAIADGRLHAMRCGTERTEAQGGDIWHIKDKWARDCIVDNVHEIDLRKADKYWFVDLMAGAV